MSAYLFFFLFLSNAKNNKTCSDGRFFEQDLLSWYIDLTIIDLIDDVMWM